MTTDQIARPSNGLAVASLCLSIVGCVFGLIPITALIAIACGLVGLILGAIAWKNSKERGRTGMAVTAIILSLIALTLGIIGMVIVQQAVDDLNHNLDQTQQEFNQP